MVIAIGRQGCRLTKWAEMVGSADLLATFQTDPKSVSRMPDEDRGHPVGALWAMLGGWIAKRKQKVALKGLPCTLTFDLSGGQILLLNLHSFSQEHI